MSFSTAHLPLVKSTKFAMKKIVADNQNINAPAAPNRGTTSYIPGLGWGFGQATAPVMQTQPATLQRQQRANGTVSF